MLRLAVETGMTDAADSQDRRRDLAARAAWLSFVRGRTQDEIAGLLGVSRQAVQRLVAFAVSERLIKFRLDHPLAECLALGEALSLRHGLEFCDVAPADPGAPGALEGVAQAAADRLGAMVAAREPVVLCVGTGRTMRAAVEQLEPISRPQHSIVSLVGAMSAGGRASPYDVVMRLGDRLGAQRYPIPCPVIAETEAERAALQGQRAFAAVRALRETARASFVGVSEIGPGAPMHADGFMSDGDLAGLLAAGAVGEITGWSFDAEGRPVDAPANRRVASLPLEIPPRRATVVAGCGPRKVAPLRAALKGGLMTALITDEPTARALLADHA
jgi:DNA-binding transcriptional regulator LsrR (DeoR family)